MCLPNTTGQIDKKDAKGVVVRRTKTDLFGDSIWTQYL